ncbi:MAG: 2-isopropylmalate synthase [Myxococcales bacterium]|nr:2-isopropylmalate synthase [Myxococcales bacterium]MCB9630161.1 2-isopropylmalate synthase [Sandaracinaceae bacterium]
MSNEDDLIYDWNGSERDLAAGVLLHDETLRDGIQDPAVVDPSVADKIEIVRGMDAVGIHSVDLGIPSAGRRAFAHALELANDIVAGGLRIKPACAGRTLVADIEPIARLSQQAGIAVEVMTFIGASPIRQAAEQWSESAILSRSVEAIAFAVREGLPVTFVTEDTTRSHPDLLAELFKAAIDTGAQRLCLCDTVGHATPNGVRSLVRFTRDIVAQHGSDARVDWHGHNDRGLALANSLEAIAAGADRIHGCWLGIGERVGNASLDQLWLNLAMMRGTLDGTDLRALRDVCERVSDATRTPIAADYPLLGANAFKTGTGVHAAAILKATSRGDRALADRVYSSVPASLLGRRQEVVVGPMSGLSNVRYWLRQAGLPDSQGLAEAVLEAAKQSDRNLSDNEIRHIVDTVSRGAAQ